MVWWVRKSKPGEYPLYVLVDNWRPVGQTAKIQTTERSSLKITIKVEPYKEHPLDYNVELKRQRKAFQSSFWNLEHRDLTEMAGYLVKGGSKPEFFKSRIHPIVLLIGSIFPPLIWIVTPRNRLIREARPTRLTAPTILGWVGLIGAAIFCVLGFEPAARYSGRVSLYFTLAVALGGLFFLGAYLAYRRPLHSAVPLQSFRTPRHEFLVDSWHVSVSEAGADFAAFEKRLVDAISIVDPAIEINKEMHQHLSPRGFEERERYVLTKGQANVHVHIYSFGRDAFVGWDGYLNWAKWAETDPVSRNVKEGVKVEYRSLQSGVHIPSEFDLIELNALTELVHRALVREIKAFLKEKEIEADLDFQIIRGDRERALEIGKDKKVKKSVKTRGYPPGL